MMCRADGVTTTLQQQLEQLPGALQVTDQPDQVEQVAGQTQATRSENCLGACACILLSGRT